MSYGKTTKAVGLRQLAAVPWQPKLDELERQAVAIARGEEEPTQDMTRPRVMKVLRQLAEAKATAMMYAATMAISEVDELAGRGLLDYVLPKAKQVVENTGRDGGPQEHVIQGDFMAALLMAADGKSRGLPVRSSSALVDDEVE